MQCPLGRTFMQTTLYAQVHTPEPKFTNICGLQGGGVHGNALLSKFDISDARLVHHRYH